MDFSRVGVAAQLATKPPRQLSGGLAVSGWAPIAQTLRGYFGTFFSFSAGVFETILRAGSFMIGSGGRLMPA